MQPVTAEAPRYRLIQPFYSSNDLYIIEGTEIEFNGTPNEQMEPLNKPAEDRMRKYLMTLEGGKTPRVEDMFYLAMKNRPREDTSVVLPHAVTEVPQQGHQRQTVSDVKILDTPTKPVRPVKTMGTVVVESAVLGENGQ